MSDEKNNLAAPPRAPARSDREVDPLWDSRDVDISALRQWFIRQVAREALKEIKREDRHVDGD